MIDFIKWNWKSLLAILLAIAALLAANAHVLKMTQGAYNMIEILFV